MTALFDSLFEYFFKYPRIAYERGEIVWSGAWSPLLLALLFVGGAGLVAWSYRDQATRTSPATRWGLATVRGLGLALLLLCLLRPTLVLSTAVPQQNIVAVIIDDSRSMGIPDVNGRTRGEVVSELFASPQSTLLRELEERFLIRHFRFSSITERLRNPEELGFQGNRTLIGPALDYVRQELSTLPLSGIVLVTDGGDQDADGIENALLGLRAEGIAVHVVGAGRERLEPDVEVERVELPRTAIRGSTVVADVVIAHAGLGGVTVPVQLEEDGRILAVEQVALTGSGGSTTVRIPVELESAGVRRLRVRVPAQPNEVVQENNYLETHVLVRDGREKILYYEGQPRFEVGFMRQAVRADENLQLVVLQRTGEERFVRLDVDSGDELSGGFPRTREELFEYRGLILGSVEASSFTPDQIRMIVDFVDRRGGGLLVLGGPRALGEGGFTNTALAPVLPVAPDPIAAPGPRIEFWSELQITPTRPGLTHPALRLDAPLPGAGETTGASDEERLARWRALPPLTTVNQLSAPRAGATVLLSGESPDGLLRDYPVLSFQRYGGGISALLAVHDSWLWQMHADIPLEDETHELFWQQLLRWLVQEVPEPLNATAVRNRVAPGEAVELLARVVGKDFLALNDARVTARVIDPFGGEQEFSLIWNLDRDGEYRGSFLPGADGPYEVHITAETTDGPLVSTPIHIEAGVLDEELRSGAMRGNLLRRIASETGGTYSALDNTRNLPEALRYTERGTVVQEERDLWDLPLFFFLLVGLLSAEWAIRRKGGLA